jgi:hypothetical protein
MKIRKMNYKEMFSQPREHFKKIFEKHNEEPPATFREAITRLQSADAPLVWSLGKWIYDRGARTDASEEAVKEFLNICPPFRALVYAMLMSW